MLGKCITWVRKPNKTFWEQIVELFVVIIPVVFLIRTFGFGLYSVPTGSMETTMLSGERFFADKFTPLFSPFKRGDIIVLNDPLYQYAPGGIKHVWQKYCDWNIANWTKRVIGEPGDHVRGVLEDGKPVVYVNDKKLNEPYLNKYPVALVVDPYNTHNIKHKTFVPELPLSQQPFYRFNQREWELGQWLAQQSGQPQLLYPGTPAFKHENVIADIFDEKLGPDEYWVMGDNRLDSMDSRYWGKLKRDLIHGRVVLCLLSLDSSDQYGPVIHPLASLGDFWQWINSFMIADLIKHPIDFWLRIRWSRCLRLVH